MSVYFVLSILHHAAAAAARRAHHQSVVGRLLLCVDGGLGRSPGRPGTARRHAPSATAEAAGQIDAGCWWPVEKGASGLLVVLVAGARPGSNAQGGRTRRAGGLQAATSHSQTNAPAPQLQLRLADGQSDALPLSLLGCCGGMRWLKGGRARGRKAKQGKQSIKKQKTARTGTAQKANPGK